jgi:signal transduction histidine kinase/ligand-binding sensor domain-containing protein
MNKFKVSLHHWTKLFLLFLLQSPLSAQDATADFTNLNLLFPDLPTSAVHGIYEDDRGIMWFCTNEGLYSFDGLAVRHFKHHPLDSNSLSGNFVYRILQDNTGRYWIGTKNGLTTYDPRQPAGKEFQRFTAAMGYPQHRVFDMVKDNDGRLWISTWGHGLSYSVDPASGTVRDIPERTARFFFEKKQNLLYIGKEWDSFGTIDPGTGNFTSWKSRIDKAFANNADIKPPAFQARYFIPFVDAAGNIWSGYMGYFYYFNPQTGIVRMFPSPAKGNEYIRLTTETPDGSIWFGAMWYGLFRYDPVTQKIIHFPYKQDTPGSIPGDITALFTDSKGTVWIGTTRGICQYSKKIQAFEIVNPVGESRGMAAEYLTYHENSDGTELFGTMVSTIIRPPRWSTPKIVPLPATIFLAGNTPGDYWVGSEHFFYKLEKDRSEYPDFICDSLTRTYIADANVIKIIGDSIAGEQVLWIATNCSFAFLYYPRTRNLKCLKEDANDPAAFPNRCMYDIERDLKGQLWFATYGGGLVRLEDKAQLKFKTWNRNNSAISSNIVSDIQFDRLGTCWVVTELGVDYFDGKTFRSAATFLPANTGQIINVTDDAAGNIWFATNRELIRLNPKDYSTAVYAYHRNFKDLALWNTTLLSKRSDGTIAIPAHKGIVFFDPANAEKQHYPSSTLITGLFIQEKPFHHLLYQPKISLAYGQNFLTFNFACLNYINSSLNHFSWKLEGADKDWITPTDNRNFASYSTLPPGDYVFRVKSCNADGVWDEKGVFIKFKIHPPWWATWWFRTLICMAIAATLFWLFKLRTARITERQQADFDKKLALESERNRIARDIHDDISSGLSAINLLANYIQQNPRNSDMHKEILCITESSREINQRLREIIWSVSSEADNLESLISFLRRYLMDFGELYSLETVFRATDEIKKIQLTGEVRQNLFLCFKEALNNVAKYAQATKLEVIITLDKKQVLLIEIKDNGIGFEWENALKKGGNGLKNIQVRMAKAGGEARFLHENGTTVILSCPV